MEMILLVEAPPLRRDASGALRVGKSRVLLELVVRAFEDGATPEVIAQQYPTTTLADIYGVIAYYLRHPLEIEAYLAEREQLAQTLHSQIHSQQGDMKAVRARLLARKKAMADLAIFGD